MIGVVSLLLVGLLAAASAQHEATWVQSIVNDVIEPNDGLFSNIVEQIGIVSFSPTPSAPTSVTPSVSPSTSKSPAASVFASSSPLASSTALPSRASSPTPSTSTSPSSSMSPVPSPQGRRPSVASASSSPSPSNSPVASPSPSPPCAPQFSKTSQRGFLIRNDNFDDIASLSATEMLTEIAIYPGANGIGGLTFTTSAQVLPSGFTTSTPQVLTVPAGETLQAARVCTQALPGGEFVNYLRFELSNGASVQLGTEPAFGCETFNAPPDSELIGKFGNADSGDILKLGFVIRGC